MRVLVLGSGGREHALAWALSNAPSVSAVACAPGNAGIAGTADVHPVDPMDTRAVVALAERVACDLVVVGPEAPLVAGVGDELTRAGFAVFGPSASAARIEGSKAFAKDVMAAAGVPTAGYWAGRGYKEALEALDRFDPPYVVKADGLAAGKGVRICERRDDAREAVRAAMVDRAFGDAGATVVLEEFLDGPEVSLFGLCDGQSVVPLVAAQDFKRALDGDQGPNTGGMGAYSPVPGMDAGLTKEIRTSVLEPVLAELNARGLRYVGVLYAGLVLTAAGPKVLEFNARFGDPETQVVLPRLRSDLGRLLLACAKGELSPATALEWDDRACVTVVLASGGYPGDYRTGKPISGLTEAAAVDGAIVFHAGTRDDGDGIVTAGGRVLSVSALGATVVEARQVAYEAAGRIRFDGAHYRTDIAAGPTT